MIEEIAHRFRNLTLNRLCEILNRLWDVHFEDCLSEDWYFGAVFGDEASVSRCSEELAEFFFENCDEYGMDYDQTDDDPEFEDLIRREAKEFIKGWRQAVVAKYT